MGSGISKDGAGDRAEADMRSLRALQGAADPDSRFLAAAIALISMSSRPRCRYAVRATRPGRPAAGQRRGVG